MKQVKIGNLDENSLFHFTLEKNIDKINKRGLVPTIGENAMNIDKTSKIFFSKGELGILKVNEVWLRWLMNRINGINDRLELYGSLTQEENQKRILNWTKEFLSGKYMEDIEKKSKLFEYFYNYLKERTYLTLDITDGIEYDSNDLDENKVDIKTNSNYITKEFAKIMYCEFSDIDNPIMDEWNMHTKTGIGVDKEKIKQVATNDGRTDMLSIVLYLYDKYKDIPHSKFLLDDFIKYAKSKEELNIMLGEEGYKNDQNNNSRSY